MPGNGRGRRGGHDDVADEALMRLLYAEHGRAVLAYATRLTGDRAAAEDVVQETLVRAWRHPEITVNGKGSVRGWLLTVARNIVTDRIRAKGARPQEVAETAAFAAASPEDVETEVVNSMVVMDAMDSLSAEHREVVERIYFRGNTVAETAAELQIPSGTVKSRTYYALRVLRDNLSPGAVT